MNNKLFFIFIGFLSFYLISGSSAENWRTDNKQTMYGVQYHYMAPVPKKDTYNIQVEIRVLEIDKFKKKARELLKIEDVREVAGMHVKWSDGTETIYLMRTENGEIDLETLGHEVFYHCMEKVK